MVYFCDYDYCDVADWTDICENSDRSYVSVLYVKALILDSFFLLLKALSALSKLYEEFHITFSYGDIVKDPQNHHP